MHTGIQGIRRHGTWLMLVCALLLSAAIVLHGLRRWQPFAAAQEAAYSGTLPVLTAASPEESTAAQPAQTGAAAETAAPPAADDGAALRQLREGQFTVLLLGLDESRSNTDVIMLLLFDLAGHDIRILQIPRDSYVPRYTDFAAGKINSVYSRGDSEKTPVQRTADCVAQSLLIPIDRCVTTGCGDIARMVDLIGGVQVEMPYEIEFEAGKIIPAGAQTLSGEQAEWLLRYRRGYAEGDIGRLKAQRIFLAAAVQQLCGLSKLKLMHCLYAIRQEKLLVSDMTADEMRVLADFTKQTDPAQITMHLLPGEGCMFTAADGTNYSVWSIHAQAAADLLNQFFRPHEPEIGVLPVTELAAGKTVSYDRDSTDVQRISEGDAFDGR
ncbi:MAG: LCP family protein [Oscillospiraceae bacterium]|nr:LCP family protein [Oscillospiraceae bacterium]